MSFPGIGITIGVDESYWFFLIVYAVAVSPFCFFNFANTKYLQYFTMICRNIAMFLYLFLSFDSFIIFNI